MARRKKFRRGLTALLAICCLIIGTIGGFYGCFEFDMMGGGPSQSDDPDFAPQKPSVINSGELSINFLELGNKFTGDCTYIKAGEVDILIDAGSKTSSIPTIDAFLKQNVADGVLEYVIVTHAHLDHYAGFATNEKTDSIFDLYECETIIDFSQTEKGKTDTPTYKNYVRERDAEVAAGAVHYTAEECMTQDKSIFDLGDGIELQILDSYFYYNRGPSENDHSVCVMINQGDRHFLFTGDLEAEGEEKLVEMNDLPEVELYKAGHHGSKTSSSTALLEVVKPKMVAVCCCCGSPEYTKTNENQFPTQAFIDRIAPYTDKVYVTTLCVDYENAVFTSMNGNITVLSSASGVSVNCSNNNTPLKDTEWFKNNRICPDAWKSAA